jgi:sugar phosphate isomerase/epimerase
MKRPEIKFYCSRWGYEAMPWKEFIEKVKQHSFQGVEIIALRYPEQKKDMLDELESSGLEYSLIHTEKKEGSDFNRYLVTLESNLYEIATGYRTLSSAPRFIISQTGREYYTSEQVGECFAVCDKVSRATGVRIIQETHRYRWSFAAHIVKEYLLKYPNLQLALDISHWFCVSESYLEDQEEAVNLALDKTFHLHARIGHTQGPQVTDPRAPENAVALEHHLKCWDKWIELLIINEVPECTITPEFGPYPYMIHTPFLNKPISDQWEINCWIKDLLAARYSRYPIY